MMVNLRELFNIFINKKEHQIMVENILWVDGLEYYIKHKIHKYQSFDEVIGKIL